MDYIKGYWPIFLSVTTVIVSLAAQWAVLGYRISAVEARQDRQGTAITALQGQTQTLTANYAELNAKIDAMNENVTYIRNRLDRVLP